MSIEYAPQFESIVSKARAEGKRMRVALAGADSESILKGVFEAEADGFVDPILIGNYKRIQAMTERIGVSDRSYDIQPIDDSTNVVQYAIEMIKAGNADCLMRGDTSTRDFLMPVLNKANHLIRDDRLVTHVVFLKIPGYEKLLAVSDVTLLINPSADGRREVLKNIVRALRVFDIEHPNIALLAMVEKPSFQMRDTVEDQTMVREHLRPGGVMVVNMNMHSDGAGSINEALCDTIAAVFPSVATADVAGNTNRELFACADGEIAARLAAGTEKLETGELRSLMRTVHARLETVEGGDKVLSDDRAPVELLGMRAIDRLIGEELVWARELYEREGLRGLIENFA